MLRHDGMEIVEGPALSDGLTNLLKRLLEGLQSWQPHPPLMGFALSIGSAGKGGISYHCCQIWHLGKPLPFSLSTRSEATKVVVDQSFQSSVVCDIAHHRLTCLLIIGLWRFIENSDSSRLLGIHNPHPLKDAAVRIDGACAALELERAPEDLAAVGDAQGPSQRPTRARAGVDVEIPPGVPLRAGAVDRGRSADDVAGPAAAVAADAATVSDGQRA